MYYDKTVIYQHKTMNKAELIKEIANKVEKPQKDVHKTLDALLETIVEKVSSGDSIEIKDFGSFKAIERKERQGINPKTSEKITIPAITIPKFTPGKNFKDVVANNY